MASIQKRGKVWRVQVKRLGKRTSKSFRIKAQALAWAQEQEALGDQIRVHGEKHSVTEALETYRDEVSVKKPGKRWEQVRLNKFIRELPFRSLALPDVKPNDIAKWRDAQKTKGSTVRREMSLLNSVFEVARKEWLWLLVNPMDDVARPSDSRPRSRLITDGEILRICEELDYKDVRTVELKKHEVAVAFLLSIETAMRSGELLTLEPGQVDLTTRVAHLLKSKNGDERSVPLTLRAIELFKCIPDGFSVSAASRDSIFREARKAAGLSGFTFHDARALALTRLSKKVDVLTLARIAGHRSLKSLMVYYRESAQDIALRL